MSTFSRVYTQYTFGGGEEGQVSENQRFCCTLLTVWPDFYYFHGEFCHSKTVDVYSFWQRGYQKMYGLYTLENVDIYGWPLRCKAIQHVRGNVWIERYNVELRIIRTNYYVA